MHTSLQRVDQPDTLNTSHVGDQKENQGIEEVQHLHLSQPSVWPLLLSGAILLCISGLLVLPNIPWLSIIALPFVLAGTVGWALEDPRSPSAFPQSAPLSTLASALVEQAHQRQEEGDRSAPPRTIKRQFLGPPHGQIWQEHDSPVTIGRTPGGPYPLSLANRGIEHEDFALASYEAVEVEVQRKEIEEVAWQGNEAHPGGDPSGSGKSLRRIVWRPF